MSIHAQQEDSTQPSIVSSVLTGRFRSKDVINRNKWRLTASLLDYLCAPYSTKLRNWHNMNLLMVLKSGKVQLEQEDML